jgi:pyridoxal phosphate enzyme (YggS family)
MIHMSAYHQLLSHIHSSGARLVAVSKTRPSSDIMALYEAGQRIFGENRVEELKEKHEALPQDIEWHMIGHLQSKKVKVIASFIAMIHSGDSPRLLMEIEKRAAQSNRVIDVLLQFKIAEEATKYGMTLEEAEEFLTSLQHSPLPHVRLCGVMGMATFTENTDQIRREFQSLQSIFSTLKSKFFSNSPHFREISMGMSGDYPIALEEGSTMVRVGSLLFGTR